MSEAADQPAVPTGATRLLSGALTQDELGQPQRQSLLSYATRPRQQKNLGQAVVLNRLSESPTGLVMPNQRVQSH
jgi:hypothetical protein